MRRAESPSSVWWLSDDARMPLLNSSAYVPLAASFAGSTQGIAKEHAKWSPVAVATYQFDPIIEINEGRCSV